MNASDPIELSELAESRAIAHGERIDEKVPHNDKTLSDEEVIESMHLEQKVYPTDEELHTLRRVAASISWVTFTVAFVEVCERFSWYGTTSLFVNFIQRPLPAHSTTGALVAGHTGKGVPGALGMGQRASTALTLFNQFWAYVMPLFGAFVADQYLGRFKVICFAIGVTLVGHVILIVSAIPSVISSPKSALGCFTVGLIIMGTGTGGFKSNISPLIAEQYREERPIIRVLPSGERVIEDPAATISRIYLYFYLMINIGSLVGQISMVYAERYVGFWLSYTLPTIMFCFAPAVLFLYRKRYHMVPPTGSVYPQAFRLFRLAMKGRWSLNPIYLFKRNTEPNDFWDRVKPSRLGPDKPQWMTFDDEWVDEVQRGLKACRVFLWYPLYWLAYNQMLNNLTSQAATMHLGGVPNDVINNLNPLSLIIFIPLMDRLVYPGLRRMGLHFTPLKRVTAGFFVASCAMVSAAVIQHYIYKDGPCGNQANYCLEVKGQHTEISVWVQAVTYILIGISEIFASVTMLEYAFTKAPPNMRSLVQAVGLFMSAISSALGQAFVGLSEDPLLVWLYVVTAILAFIGCVGFWLTNYKVDREEDALNMLPRSEFLGRKTNDEET